jgi:peptidoglycan hydrolase FlgJ
MISPLKTPPTKLPVKGAAGAPPSSAAPKSAPDPELAKAAKAFEALLMRQMIGAMRNAKLADDPLSSGAGDMFRDMADARTADAMAASGLGIADMMVRQFANRGGPQR